MAPSESASAAPIEGGLLDKVLKAGKIVMSTDPQYPPQSSLKTDGTYEGFDIDVGTEIAKRLGVEIAFETPSWDALTAGAWAERWDFSVGSMTITSQRQKVLDFSDPYYFTPAQMAASTASGITTLDGLAGKTVCVGSATTYLDWLNGDARLRDRVPVDDRRRPASRPRRSTRTGCAPRRGRRAGRTSRAGSAPRRPSSRRSRTGCRS